MSGRPPVRFHATERPELWVDKVYVEQVVAGERDAALVCATPPKEFSGEVVTRARGGHIPGSSSAPAGRLVDRGTNLYLDAAALRAVFEPALDAPPIVAYCNGAIAACSAALALTLLGERSIAIYDGSLAEWAADPQAPMVASEALVE